MIKKLVLALVALLAGCSSPGGTQLPDLFHRSVYHAAPGELIKQMGTAPLWIVGTVEGVRDLGQPVHTREEPRILAQLTRITLRVEIVAKGEFRGSEVDYYCYVYSKSNSVDLGVIRYLPIVGQRRVFFLLTSAHGYRAVGDVADYTLPVLSGFHERGSCFGVNPGTCIGKILLVPAAGYDSQSLAIGLRKAVYATELLASKAVAQDLLELLSRNPDRPVSVRAKTILEDMQAGRW